VSSAMTVQAMETGAAPFSGIVWSGFPGNRQV
jgi:hypothetical protein